MRDIDAVGFGALNVDRLLQVRNLESKDTELVALSETTTPGGSAANTIYALAKLGLRTAYMGAVGVDAAGHLVKESFAEVGVGAGWMLQTPQMPTGEALCLTDRTGRRLIVLQSGANKLYSSSDVAAALETLIPRARLVHLTSFADVEQIELQLQLVRLLPSAVMLTSAPGALYVREGLLRIEPILARCDYVFFNWREITELMGCRDDEYERASYSFLARFPHCRAVVVTLGRGKSDRESKEVLEQPHLPFAAPGEAKRQGSHLSSIVVGQDGQAYPVLRNGVFGTVLDTTGAGDAYAAGFTYGILTDRPLGVCAEIGHVVAQLSVLAIGAREKLPSRLELESKLADRLAYLAKLQQLPRSGVDQGLDSF